MQINFTLPRINWTKACCRLHIYIDTKLSVLIYYKMFFKTPVENFNTYFKIMILSLLISYVTSAWKYLPMIKTLCIVDEGSRIPRNVSNFYQLKLPAKDLTVNLHLDCLEACFLREMRQRKNGRRKDLQLKYV